MNKYLRFVILLGVLFGVVILAGCGSNAANPAPDVIIPSANDAAQSGSPATGDNPAGAFQGSVDAPGCDEFSFSTPDKYSVCGFAVLNAITVDDKVMITVRMAEADETPAGAGKTLVQTIRIEWSVDGKMEAGPNEKYADVDLCYSAFPGKVLVIRYYDETQKAWTDLETTAEEEQVCTKMTMTGFYVLAEKE